MEPNFQTSFIPKKPIVVERASGGRSVGIFTVIAIFLLFAVIFATGGLYIYKGVLAKSMTQKESDLALAKNRFEPSKITELQVLDKRLQAATEILTEHIAVTPIFQALSAITMKTVRYNQFSYSLASEPGSKVHVKMSGIAVGYRSVALQSDLFSTKEIGKNFIDPIFSNLTLDNTGNVLFDLDFSVDPSFVDYKQMLSSESPA